jgi:lipid-binding SYLF domain-containing protein
MKNARTIALLVALLTISTLTMTGCTEAEGVTAADKRESVMEMHNAALEELYQKRPETKSMIKSAPGYAVFSDVNVNLIFVSAATGHGVAVDSSGQQTYMKMAQVGIGLGLGIKDFRAIFIFENAAAFDKFVNKGWEFEAQADASAKAEEKGGATSGAATFQDFKIYKITKSGISLQATIAGTKYWKDAELN